MQRPCGRQEHSLLQEPTRGLRGLHWRPCTVNAGGYVRNFGLHPQGNGKSSTDSKQTFGAHLSHRHKDELQFSNIQTRKGISAKSLKDCTGGLFFNAHTFRFKF